MFYNYLKIAFRSLQKNSLFSAINIFGLALSMSVCLIAIMIIKDAYTYDTFHPHRERTFRIITDVTTENGNRERWGTVPLPLAERLTADYSVVEKSARVYNALSDQGIYDAKTIGLEGAFTEPAFFDVFGFEMLYGDKTSALEQPYSIVLTQNTSELFFKNGNPVGKTIEFKNLGKSFTVTGVIKANSKKTHLDNDAYASFSTLPSLEAGKKIDSSLNNWKNYGAAATYVLLKKEASEKSLQHALTNIAGSKKPLNKNIGVIKYDLQNLADISPGEELKNGGDSVSTIVLLAIGGITFLILLLACFNYTNLSLARSLTRAKEVGIRKVVGGSRSQLFFQFITEAIVVALLALGVASLLLNFLLQIPAVAEGILQKAKPDAAVWLMFILFALCTGIIAGTVPAWILSSFKPAQVIKNLSSIKIFKGLGLQKTLIVIQFAVSLIFIVFLSTIYFQTRYLTSFSYGFKQENIMNILLPAKGRQVFKEEIARIPGVQQTAASSSLFGFHPGNLSLVKLNKTEEGIVADNFFIDADFIPLMGLQIIAGNNFRQAYNTSGSSVILNERAVKSSRFKDPADAVGRMIFINDTTSAIVAGVVKDFNYLNPKHPIGNLTLVYAPERCQYLAINILPQNGSAIVAAAQPMFKRLYPESTFIYSWLDKELKSIAANSDMGAKSDEFAIVVFLAVMAITIACIGLLGIATYTARIRQKEVGIRKIMGASVKAIVMLLSKDFIKLLLIASAIALPVGYILSSSFLHEFAYRIDVGWEILVLGVLLILMLGLFTICSQTLKAAMANPVKNLRTE